MPTSVVKLARIQNAHQIWSVYRFLLRALFISLHKALRLIQGDIRLNATQGDGGTLLDVMRQNFSVL
jgi:hypothetical protein